MRKVLLIIFVWDAKRELEGRVYIGASLRDQVLGVDSTGLELYAQVEKTVVCYVDTSSPYNLKYRTCEDNSQNEHLNSTGYLGCFPFGADTLKCNASCLQHMLRTCTRHIASIVLTTPSTTRYERAKATTTLQRSLQA